MTPEQRIELLKRVSHCESAFHDEQTDWRCAGFGLTDRCRDSLVKYVDSIIGWHVQREAELTAEIARLRDELQLKCSPAVIATQVPDVWRDVLAEVLSEAEGWIDDARGCAPADIAGYTGWAERARALLEAAPQPTAQCGNTPYDEGEFTIATQPTSKESSPVDPLAEPIAWESITQVYTKYVSERRYQNFRPETQRWYKPYRCSNCAAISAMDGDK